MNPLIRKELRLILPAWLLAMVLASVPVWIFWPLQRGLMLETPGPLIFVPFGLGVLLLSLAPFGQELSLGTFSSLLAQPVSRRRFWLVKTVLLGVGLLLAFGALCLSNHLRVDSALESMKSTVWRNLLNRAVAEDQVLKMIAETRQVAVHDSLMFGGLTALAAFAGGLWTTLLFRQTSAALWFTFLVPSGLALLAGKLFGIFSERLGDIGMCLALGLYAAAGFLWAKRLFLQAQDAQWTGGVIALPDWRRWSAQAAPVPAKHRRKPFRALLRKEFQLQQVNLILAGGLLLLHLAVVLIRRLGSDYLASHRTTAMTLESFWILWLVMPLLIAGTAVAEERKLGTLEGFLCLPTTRRMQFILKFAVALLLGICLGGIMPLVLEWFGKLIGIYSTSSELMVGSKLRSFAFISLVSSVGLTIAALYSSTLTRHTLQAIGLAVTASVISCVTIALAAQPPPYESGIILWRGPLVSYIGWPVMIATVLLLAYGNYKRLHPGPRIWLRNVFTLLLSLAAVGVVTTVVYHRAWEVWLPEEPLHSWNQPYFLRPETRIMGVPSPRLVATPHLEARGARIALLLPDGRLWLRQGRVDPSGLTPNFPGPRAAGPWREGFVGGSEWREVAVSEAGCFAIQADGSLWDISDVQIGKQRIESGPKRFDGSHDWKKISAGGEHFTALKSDGTLWEWGKRMVVSGKTISRQAIPMPGQVGKDNDWVAICDANEASVAVKADGSIWGWGLFFSGNTNGARAARRPGLPEKWFALPGKQPLSIAEGGNGVAVVCTDGSLWVGGGFGYHVLSLEGAKRIGQEMRRVGTDSDWREVRQRGWWGLVAIKQNGCLYEWTDRYFVFHPIDLAPPASMPSRYCDWLTACPFGNAFLALAGDGSLCLWGDPDNEGRMYADWRPDPDKLLLPSRIKARRLAQFNPMETAGSAMWLGK